MPTYETITAVEASSSRCKPALNWCTSVVLVSRGMKTTPEPSGSTGLCALTGTGRGMGSLRRTLLDPGPSKRNWVTTAGGFSESSVVDPAAVQRVEDAVAAAHHRLAADQVGEAGARAEVVAVGVHRGAGHPVLAGQDQGAGGGVVVGQLVVALVVGAEQRRSAAPG